MFKVALVYKFFKWKMLYACFISCEKILDTFIKQRKW